jgi:hypothetical protein
MIDPGDAHHGGLHYRLAGGGGMLPRIAHAVMLAARDTAGNRLDAGSLSPVPGIAAATSWISIVSLSTPMWRKANRLNNNLYDFFGGKNIESSRVSRQIMNEK